MMNVLLGLLVLLAAGFAFCIVAARRAPVGYQDQDGFHYGPDAQPCAEPEALPDVVPALGH
jgi:hypothetical protein